MMISFERQEIERLRKDFGGNGLFYIKGLVPYLDDYIQNCVIEYMKECIVDESYDECKKALEDVKKNFIFSEDFAPKVDWSDRRWSVFINKKWNNRSNMCLLEVKSPIKGVIDKENQLILHHIIKYHPHEFILSRRYSLWYCQEQLYP